MPAFSDDDIVPALKRELAGAKGHRPERVAEIMAQLAARGEKPAQRGTGASKDAPPAAKARAKKAE